MYEFAHLGHTNESFKELKPLWQDFVKELKGVMKLDQETRQLLWGAFNKYNVKINYDLFGYLQDGDSVEMWTDQMVLMLAIGKVAKNCTYTIDELRSDQWENLFYRPEKNKHDILQGIITAKTTNSTCFDCGEWHEVMELKTRFKYKQQIKVKLITPYQMGDIKGFLAVVQSRPPLRVYDRLKQSFLTWIYMKLNPLKNYQERLF